MAERDSFTKPGPLVLDAQAAENWRKFLMRFEIYMIAKEKDGKPDKLKVNLLLNCAGSEAIEEYSHFVFAEGESQDCYKDVCKKFQELCEGAKNVIYERLVFNRRNQNEGERIDNFVSELKRLSLTCDFENLRDTLIRDRIVGGVLSDELRGHLLKKPDLSLQQAHDYCRTFEAAESQKYKFNVSQGSSESGIQAIKKQREGKKSQQRESSWKSCKFCGYKHSFSHPTKCPAFKKACRKCKKEGHFEKMCKEPTQNSAKVDTMEQLDAKNEENDSDNQGAHSYFGSIELGSVTNEGNKNKSMISVKIAGHDVKIKADTGADATVIPYHLYKKITNKPLQKIKQPLKGWLATKPIHPKGCVRLSTHYRMKIIDLLYLVVEGNFVPLLGCDACLDLEVLKFMNLDLIDSPSIKPDTPVPGINHLNILKSDPLLSEYKDCFSYKPGKLKAEVHLEIDQSFTPVIHAPRKIPIALLKPVEDKLKEMEKDAIIVKEEGHTPWVSSMVVVDKRKVSDKEKGNPPSEREVRICIDPRDLNKALKRPHYPMVTVEEVSSRLSGANIFTSLDACSGFWQLPVDEVSSKLLTFNTPWGRYRFTRLPFGIAPAPEIYQREMIRLFEGIPVEIIMDDFLIHGNSQSDIDQNLRLVLDRSRQVGLKFNPDKLKLRVPEIGYVGHLFTAEGVRPDPEKVRAISELPAPTDKDGVLRILGTVNYLDKFIQHKADIQQPITQLTQKSIAFVWDKPQQEALDNLKTVLTSAPVLAYFDNNKETVLNVDASGIGLGAVIMQEGRPVAYGSRTLSSCEKRYANIERELLAIVWGAQKFHTYVYGRRVVVETDHRPLEAIFKKPLNEAPPRLQRMLLRLTKYDLVVKYVPGKQQVISDCLSRAPLLNTETEQEDVIGVNLVEQLGLESNTLQRFRDATGGDETSKVVMDYVLSGWPFSRADVDEIAREYWNFREELSVEDGLLFKSDRIVVPRALRADVLDEIHGAHMGETKSLCFARDYVFWPSMTNQIKDKVSSCPICNSFRNQQQKESLMPREIPGLPWQVVGTDLFDFAGKDYLLVTDFYSKYFEIELLRQSTAFCVINNLKKIFARYGIPDEVVSDNGSQYSNTRNLFDSTHQFKQFAKEWGFRHTTSSPQYPQSNGASEKAVQTAKRILKKAAADKKDPFEGLLKYRNTPFEDIGVSPAQLLMGRRTRTMIPTHRRLLLPQTIDPDRVVKSLSHRQLVSKKNYDKTSRDLPPLAAGDRVRIRPNNDREWRKAEVLPRSYMVEDEQGRVYRRNRRQIISVPHDGAMVPQETTTSWMLPESSRQVSKFAERSEQMQTSQGHELPTKKPEQSVCQRTSGRQIRTPQRLIESC